MCVHALIYGLHIILFSMFTYKLLGIGCDNDKDI